MSEILEFIESHISWVVWLLIIVGLGASMIGYSKYTDYINLSDQVVSRSGGLTKSAYNTLHEEGVNNYSGFFDVQLDKDHKYTTIPADYGDDVTYQPIIKLPILGKTIRNVGTRTIQNDVRVDPDANQ